MARLAAAHGAIEYEVEGEAGGEPIVLVTGLGAQLVRWSPEFRDSLVARGFQVIRIDNRDSGLSHHHHEIGRLNLKAVVAAVAAGERPDLPYTLGDMAGDVVTLLDALGIGSAHIVGTSMGGYIAQHLAFGWPERVRTLTLIMTASGNPALPPPGPAVLAMLAERSVPGEAPAALIERGVANQRLIGSPAYPFDADKLRARIAAEMARGGGAEAYARQRAAILADGDRRDRVKTITAPTLVLHGDSDPLVGMEGGVELAELIPGAALTLYPGMGHEIPEALIGTIVNAIADHALTAR